MNKRRKPFEPDFEERVVELLNPPILRLCADNGGTLELIMWKGEPAVIVDGYIILRRSKLVEHIGRTGGPKRHGRD